MLGHGRTRRQLLIFFKHGSGSRLRNWCASAEMLRNGRKCTGRDVDVNWKRRRIGGRQTFRTSFDRNQGTAYGLARLAVPATNRHTRFKMIIIHLIKGQRVFVNTLLKDLQRKARVNKYNFNSFFSYIALVLLTEYIGLNMSLSQ